MDESFRQAKYLALISAREKLLEKMKLEEDVVKIEKSEGTTDFKGIDYWRFQVDVTEQKVKSLIEKKESLVASLEQQIQNKNMWLDKCRKVLTSFEQQAAPKTKTYHKMKAQVEQLARDIEIWKPVAAGGIPIPRQPPSKPEGVPPPPSGGVPPPAPPPPPAPKEYDPSQEPTNEAEFEIWLAAKRAAAEERQKKELATFYGTETSEPPAQTVITNTKKKVMKIVKK